MPVHIRQASVSRVREGGSALRQALVTPESVRNAAVQVDQWLIEPGGAVPFALGKTDLAWLQLLEGSAALTGPAGEHPLADTHVAFLPPGVKATLRSGKGAALFFARVPGAERHDPALAENPPAFRLVDWSKEPFLGSKHDGRNRIYIVTPKLFGTRAVKGEMIFYPAGERCPNHQHRGADHFFYVIRGGGTFHCEGQAIRLSPGDAVYVYPEEWHYFVNDAAEPLVFAEYFVPGEYETVWEDPSRVCTWFPTGKNIQGGPPSREIREHSLGWDEKPEDV